MNREKFIKTKEAIWKKYENSFINSANSEDRKIIWDKYIDEMKEIRIMASK